MAEIDDELVARAIRWCAEAGRHATAEAVRAALAPLSWDQLLAARALLADPPAGRPLGPHALADMARGAPADVAAERERGGRYAPEDRTDAAPAGGAPAPRRSARRAATAARRGAPVIRRARDRVAESPGAAPRLPPVDALFAAEGRAVLEGWIRRHGARAGPLARELASGWTRGDGGPPGQVELRALLDAHGMSRAFARRERDEALHALRAAGGVKRRAAAALELAPDELDRLLERLGAREKAEAIREERRRALRRRATLSERARLLLTEAARLEDLGLTAELEADLRERLPDHLRALRAAEPGPLLPVLSRSLALPREEVEALAARLGLDLARQPAAAPPGASGTPSRPGGPSRRGPAARSGSGSRSTPRPGARPAPRRGSPPAGRRPPGRPRPGTRRPTE